MQTRLQYAKGDEPPSELFKDLYDGVWPALIVGTPAGRYVGSKGHSSLAIHSLFPPSARSVGTLN